MQLSPIDAKAHELAAGYIAHFGPQDAGLTYTHSETPLSLYLGANVWLVGVVDAQGVRNEDGRRFFREDKTASPRKRDTWKRHWVMSPQALTYGVLTGGDLFLVRNAFKSTVPTYDHEWFTLSEEEKAWWRDEVLNIAMEIHEYRSLQFDAWPLNIEHGCFQFGEKLPCPFYSNGCSMLDFDHIPMGSIPTQWHFPMPSNVPLDDPNAVILDATRIKAWMRCRHYYKRTYEKGGYTEMPSEALLVGSAFHKLTAIYTQGMIKEKKNEVK